MKFNARLLSFALAVLCAAPLCASGAPADDYPSRPIKLVVPFPPDGSSDIPARLLAKKLEKAWGQPVIVENLAGATGTVGEAHVAKAAPDGYTLLMATTSSHTMGPYLAEKRTYDPVADLKPVTLLAWVPHLVVVRRSLPAHSLRELIELARRKPGELNYATSGNGSSVHLATEIFSRKAQVAMNQVPYRGVSPAAQAVASGEVDLMFPPAVVALPHLKSGAMRALATLSPQRMPGLPDVPTMAEAGLDDYTFSTWLGLLAPAGTPDGIVQKLQAQMADILAMPDVREALAGMSLEPAATGSAEFGQLIEREAVAHRELIKDLGL